jgi:hypothetical protein
VFNSPPLWFIHAHNDRDNNLTAIQYLHLKLCAFIALDAKGNIASSSFSFFKILIISYLVKATPMPVNDS